MPDSTENLPIAAHSETTATAAGGTKIGSTPSAPVDPAPDDADFFGIVHGQSLALLQCQEQALRYAVDRTQEWIDCGAVWMNGCTQLSRKTVDTSRDSFRTAIEDSAKLFRIWTDIGFQAAAPFAGPNTQAN